MCFGNQYSTLGLKSSNYDNSIRIEQLKLGDKLFYFHLIPLRIFLKSTTMYGQANNCLKQLKSLYLRVFKCNTVSKLPALPDHNESSMLQLTTYSPDSHGYKEPTLCDLTHLIARPPRSKGSHAQRFNPLNRQTAIVTRNPCVAI